MSTTAPTITETTAPAINLRVLARLRWLETDSSAISQFAYEPHSSTLFVQMRSNTERVYAYRGVEPETFLALSTASSHGSFFARNIRNAYAAERIEFAVSEVA